MTFREFTFLESIERLLNQSRLAWANNANGDVMQAHEISRLLTAVKLLDRDKILIDMRSEFIASAKLIKD